MFDLEKLYDVAEARLKAYGHSIPRRNLLGEAMEKTDFQTLVAKEINRTLKEAMSADDFPNLTSNVRNKYLRPEYNYMDVVGTYAPYTFDREIKDFKPVRVVGITEYGLLQQVPGQFAEALQFTSSAEETVNYLVTLYGRRTEELWHLLVNDDLDSFSREMGKLTRAAWRTKATLVANVFNLNPNWDVDATPVFTAGAWPGGHANTFALGLNAANLATAQGALRSQVDANGNNIMVGRYYLVVCPALEYTAMQLWWQGGGAFSSGVASIMDRTSATQPHMFADMGMQRPIVNPFITGTTTAWYLVADPRDVAFIEIGHVAGLGAPQLLTMRGHWNESILGFQVDQNFTSQNGVIITHGQDVIDPRGAVRGNV